MKQFALLQGRLRRLTYGAQLAVVVAPLAIVHPLADTASWQYQSLATLLVVVCTAAAALLAVRRLHDLGLSGWHSLALTVPILNLPGLLLLLLLPGTPGQNRWGLSPVSPSRLDRRGFRLAVPRRPNR